MGEGAKGMSVQGVIAGETGCGGAHCDGERVEGLGQVVMNECIRSECGMEAA